MILKVKNTIVSPSLRSCKRNLERYFEMHRHLKRLRGKKELKIRDTSNLCIKMAKHDKCSADLFFPPTFDATRRGYIQSIPSYMDLL